MCEDITLELVFRFSIFTLTSSVLLCVAIVICSGLLRLAVDIWRYWT